jgi:hypothetical protein
MTLVLTEVSKRGIAMVTDSAISRLRRGRLETVDQQQWKKLFKVESIRAGISYWGSIGYINSRFDDWLEQKIKNGPYRDLPSLADYLATEMNKAVNNKPIPAPAGVHVAGFHRWSDGNRRPTFFHVHNGHGQIGWGASITNGKIVLTRPTYQGEPRHCFARHNDFPNEKKTVEENLGMLDTGYLTRNGDYSAYIVISAAIGAACSYLNNFPNVSIPRASMNIGVRVGFLKLLMETVIDIYKCSSMPEVIGGKVLTLGITPNGTYL